MNWLIDLFRRKPRHIAYTPAHRLIAPTWPHQPLCVVWRVEYEAGAPVAVHYTTCCLN